MNLKGDPKLKHPFKRLISEIEVSQEFVKRLENSEPQKVTEKDFHQLSKSFPQPVLIRSSGTMVGLTPVKVGNQKYFIPEPDPIVLNYNIAYEHWRSLRDADPAQFAKLQNAMQVEDHRNLLYSYCGRAITFITSLFTAVEATLNRAIPSDYIHVRIETKQSVSRNKQQLMEFASFTDKLQVIKAATGKDFMKHPLQYEKINKLKELRDMIIHPKDASDQLSKYPELYSRLFRIHFAYHEIRSWGTLR